MIINKLPVPTWTWLKGNQVTLDWEENSPLCVTSEEQDTLRISTDTSPYSQGAAEYTGQAKENTCFLQIFTGEKNLHFKTQLTNDSTTNLCLVQLFLNPSGSTTINQVDCQNQGQGQIQLVQLFLGKGDVYSQVETHLTGTASSFLLDAGYLTIAQTLDMNLLVRHIGENTNSELNLEGLIGEKGKKVFRGTIDLQHGAKGAVGHEQETVLLLGEDVQNLSIPVLLCGQEDVKGAHGAAIGELDEETLFYLNSRGIDKNTAQKMMIHAKMERVIQKIPDMKIAEQVHSLIEEVITHD